MNIRKESESLVRKMAAGEECVWINPYKQPCAQAVKSCPVTMADVRDAAARMERFRDYFVAAFPETAASGGILESELRQIPRMQTLLSGLAGVKIPGKVYTKLDAFLPISGSIKARGGIYEVLKTAEDIALRNGMLREGESYRVFASQDFRNLFSRYSIAVGSTGNLGLSIGIISAKLGFQVAVHMSADAKQWKKDLLRSYGVTVVEYENDYSIAVANGRREAENDPYCHFVDDENSKTLFLGYAVAALRLRDQFSAMGVAVDETHPLFVYLPCGVGGGPGGVAFGLKLVFGDAVHCFFAEPTHSCCMMLGMATGLHNGISVQQIGLDNRTAADGLAVGRASSFIGRTMEPFMSGCYSLTDERMFRLLYELAETEQIRLEPSALAGFWGPVLQQTDRDMRAYFERVAPAAENASYICWATGGGMVPETEMRTYIRTGKEQAL